MSPLRAGDINGDGRQDLVYIKDRNCAGNATGFPNDLISNAASAVRFRYMVALGQDTGLQAASPADIFPLRTPPGAAQIPSCDSNGAATQFEGNEAIRWDLIWHLFDLTGDGRDDLIAQVPDFSACTTCFRWQVYPAQLDGGSFWTFAAVGIDLNLAVAQDLDTSLADWTPLRLASPRRTPGSMIESELQHSVLHKEQICAAKRHDKRRKFHAAANRFDTLRFGHGPRRAPG